MHKQLVSSSPVTRTPTIPLVASADGHQSRRECAPASWQSQLGPGADVHIAVLCFGEPMIVRVSVGTCRGVLALACMPVRAGP